MFDLKNIQKMQQAMQARMEEIEAKLATEIVEAASGGGVVSVKFNGQQKLVSIKVLPDAIDPDDIEMLQDLVLAAVNAGLERSKELREKRMSEITGGMKLPGM